MILQALQGILCYCSKVCSLFSAAILPRHLLFTQEAKAAKGSTLPREYNMKVAKHCQTRTQMPTSNTNIQNRMEVTIPASYFFATKICAHADAQLQNEEAHETPS